MHQKHNVSMVQALRDEVVARIEERKREYEGILNAKASQFTHLMIAEWYLLFRSFHSSKPPEAFSDLP
jgi:deoxyadenosine/deoxycytidine kinase